LSEPTYEVTITPNDAKRALFGWLMSMEPRYQITDENESVIEALLLYFRCDPEFANTTATENKPSLDKGILLIGNWGSGKSTLMSAFQRCRFPNNDFSIITTKQLEGMYYDGDKARAAIDLYGTKATRPYFDGKMRNYHCLFDDWGQERPVFGTTEVMERVILGRYDHIKKGLKTHATTNLNLQMIKERYGGVIESRCYDMFNIIKLGAKADSTDWRKWKAER
jgi:hypothetical protein